MPIVPNGKATRPSGLHDVPDSQRAERYQARDLTILAPVNPPLAWRRAVPIVAVFCIYCMGLFLPWPVQVGVGVAVAFVALVVAYRATR